MLDHIDWPLEGWTRKQTELAGFVVSTVQLRVFDDGWETLVFRLDDDGRVDWSEVGGERHPDEGTRRATALRIHDEYVSRWTS